MEQDEVIMRGKVAWTGEEDDNLKLYVNAHGPHHWDTMATKLGIGRSGNSCRLRWFNYLSPDIRRSQFTNDEMLMILNLHRQFGNRWATIAKILGGRTDNDIKNFWNTQLKKEAKKLNCDVNSQEFLIIMTARLTETTNSMGGGGGGTEATMVTSFSTASTHELDSSNYSWPANQESSDYGPISDEFWANLGSICDLDIDDDFPNLDG